MLLILYLVNWSSFFRFEIFQYQQCLQLWLYGRVTVSLHLSTYGLHSSVTGLLRVHSAVKTGSPSQICSSPPVSTYQCSSPGFSQNPGPRLCQRWAINQVWYVQGKFQRLFFIALEPEVEFKTGLIEFYIMDFIAKLESLNSHRTKIGLGEFQCCIQHFIWKEYNPN